MSETLTWIVGRGGMLGSALSRRLRVHDPRPSRALGWGTVGLHDQLAAGAAELALEVARRGLHWRVCWCAGAGVVGTSVEALSTETESLRYLLTALAAQPELRTGRGSFLLTSSAGGVHGGDPGLRISEESPPRPISAYGRAKLEQELLLAEMATQFEGLSTLIARLSNLYGPGQRLNKPQGLISQMARSIVRDQPVRIFVPLDTTRDYLFVDDAAEALTRGLDRLSASHEPLRILKLYAVERGTSIASLLAIFRGIAKRRLKVVTGSHAAAGEQPRHLSFRSNVWPEDAAVRRTDLVAGVALTYRDQLRAFQRATRGSAP
jgi:UDP-glucose 4-epimerase